MKLVNIRMKISVFYVQRNERLANERESECAKTYNLLIKFFFLGMNATKAAREETDRMFLSEAVVLLQSIFSRDSTLFFILRKMCSDGFGEP